MGEAIYHRRCSQQGIEYMITLYAPAKLNLVLEVLGKRDDGYHEIRSLVQTVSLYDKITVQLAEDLSVICTEPDIQIPDNLVLKAAALLREVTGYGGGARITLKKGIPLSAGLGGGSSDAAAVLMTLNKLWELYLTPMDMAGLSAKLGSDVPLFIYGGTLLVEGRGEKITPLPARKGLWFVLLMPSIPVMLNKTRKMYGFLQKQDFTDGEKARIAGEKWAAGGQINQSNLYNVFDQVAFQAFPGLEAYWQLFQQAGAADIHLTGSGPTLFAMVDGEDRAREICRGLSMQGLKAQVISTVAEDITLN
jgi:4-diphosphocytidyl-2-C-methyl-D-erythritol kinase